MFLTLGPTIEYCCANYDSSDFLKRGVVKLVILLTNPKLFQYTSNMVIYFVFSKNYFEAVLSKYLSTLLLDELAGGSLIYHKCVFIYSGKIGVSDSIKLPNH